jgi:hypothetical protein
MKFRYTEKIFKCVYYNFREQENDEIIWARSGRGGGGGDSKGTHHKVGKMYGDHIGFIIIFRFY